jgi:hypothetical protein
MLPLLSVVQDAGLRSEFREIALSAQATLVAERGLLVEAQVLEILSELMLTSGKPVVAVAEIAAGLIERYGTDYERPITNRWIGGILRTRLNLKTYKSHGVYVVPTEERQKMELLCARYGVHLTTNMPTERQAGDVGMSGT